MALELDERQRAMLQEMGVKVWLPGTTFAPAALHRTAPGAGGPQSKPTRSVSATASAPPGTGHAPAPETGTMDWPALRRAAAGCRACSLCAGRKQTTLQPPAHGPGLPARADWMVVGDPPDVDEDAAGTAFTDANGILLANMLKAIGLVRLTGHETADGNAPPPSVAAHQAAYVSNVVKCRPPHGAVPQTAELAKCAVFLQREIALVQPKILLSMGRFANQLLLGDNPALAQQPLGKLRGTVHRYQGIPVVVTYHPTNLMRNSADKAKAWADLCLAADTVDALGRADA